MFDMYVEIIKMWVKIYETEGSRIKFLGMNFNNEEERVAYFNALEFLRSDIPNSFVEEFSMETGYDVLSLYKEMLEEKYLTYNAAKILQKGVNILDSSERSECITNSVLNKYWYYVICVFKANK